METEQALVQDFLRNGGRIRRFEPHVRSSDDAVIGELARLNVVVKRSGHRVSVRIADGRFQAMRWHEVLKLRDTLRQLQGLEPISRPRP